MIVYHDMPLKYVFEFSNEYPFLVEASWLQAVEPLKGKQLKLLTGELHKKRPITWILDPGPDGTTSVEEYLRLLETYTPDQVVMLDIPGDMDATLNSYRKLLKHAMVRQYVEMDMMIFPVQGRNEKELLTCARKIERLTYNMCMVPILGIPYRRFGGNTCLERARNRVNFICKTAEENKWPGPIHLLGMWDICEVAMLIEYVDSIDTRYAFLQAALNKSSMDIRAETTGFGRASKNFHKTILTRKQRALFFKNCQVKDDMAAEKKFPRF